jgi:uncharacterized protein YndB with AHSA1/START domain
MSMLKSPLQLDQRIIIQAKPEKVWELFNDQSLLSKWTCDVQHCHYERRMAQVGQVRTNDCIVNGQSGTIRSKCLLLRPFEKVEFEVEHDTFGMNRYLAGIGFAAIFKDVGVGVTEFIMQSHYLPKHLLVKMMNPIVKLKMSKEVDLMLEGLKNFVEHGQVNLRNPINQS